MANDEQLSQQDIQDLQVIASHLPTGHPMQKKLSVLLNSQPTQFEKDRPQIPEDYGFTPGNMFEGAVKGVGNAIGGLATAAVGPGTPVGALRMPIAAPQAGQHLSRNSSTPQRLWQIRHRKPRAR